MAHVTNDGQTRASTTSPLMSQTSHLRDLRQTGWDVMTVLVSQEADVLLANLAYGHDTLVLGWTVMACCRRTGGFVVLVRS